MRHAKNNISGRAKAMTDLFWPSALVWTQATSNGEDAGHGVVGSSKLRRVLKLTVFACESVSRLKREGEVIWQCGRCWCG